MSILNDIFKYSKFAFDLRNFLRDTVSLEQSLRIIANRLQNREKNFLSLVQKGIYKNTRSPYLTLLKMAGCEYGDIERMVNKDGIESTLNTLLTKGVYVSWEEFKCKTDIVRGSSRFHFNEVDFDNPFLARYYEERSSGSRSTGTRTTFDLSTQLDQCYYTLPSLAANDALDIPLALLKPVLPSAAGINNILRFWKVGKPVDRWFTPVTEKEVRASLRDRVALRYIIHGGRLWGAKLVYPEYICTNEIAKVAQWMADMKKQFGGSALNCTVSGAVNVCQAATEFGLDIGGTRFMVGGEPLTEAKRRYIETTGAFVTSRYVITEIGHIGYGCPKPYAIDDIHLIHDSIALIQRQRKVENFDMQINSFLFTCLLPSTPKMVLNLESDDYGTTKTSNCGCLWEQIGFHHHLSTIRSFTKLTGRGMTILGSDFVRILEEVLPRKYGGSPTDYQLLEEEDSGGQTMLSLVISHRVGKIDNDEVITTVLHELRKNIYGGKLAAGLWSQAKTLQIKRMEPVTLFGKVVTLHLMNQNRLNIQPSEDNS